MSDIAEELRNGAMPPRETLSSSPSLLQALSGWAKGRLLNRSEATLKETIEEAIEEAIEEHDGDAGALSEEERTLLKNILNFGELTVGDITVPRSDIVAIQLHASLEELQALAIKDQHTRLPVYEDDLDNIKGFLHLKDLIQYLGCDVSFSIEEVLRDLLFVPPSMRIVDLLVKMRVSGCHMAIVVDEYGATDGLVTMEDLFEELVGEIQDEHDDDEAFSVTYISEGVVEVDARIDIEQLEKDLSVDIMLNNEEEIDTLAGLVFAELGRVPARGEVFPLRSTLQCEIISADPRRIYKVKLTTAGKSA